MPPRKKFDAGPDLFDFTDPAPEPTPPELLTPTDPNVLPEDEERLGDQCRAVLEALREGPKSNKQLSLIALNYSSRTSDLRKHGYDVRVIERRDNGFVMYGLFVGGELVGGRGGE